MNDFDLKQFATEHQYNLIETPKYAWKCQLIPSVELLVEEGKQPNWFHRKMQHLVFGFKWDRIE